MRLNDLTMTKKKPDPKRNWAMWNWDNKSDNSDKLKDTFGDTYRCVDTLLLLPPVVACSIGHIAYASFGQQQLINNLSYNSRFVSGPVSAF